MNRWLFLLALLLLARCGLQSSSAPGKNSSNSGFTFPQTQSGFPSVAAPTPTPTPTPAPVSPTLPAPVAPLGSGTYDGSTTLDFYSGYTYSTQDHFTFPSPCTSPHILTFVENNTLGAVVYVTAVSSTGFTIYLGVQSPAPVTTLTVDYHVGCGF